MNNDYFNKRFNGGPINNKQEILWAVAGFILMGGAIVYLTSEHMDRKYAKIIADIKLNKPTHQFIYTEEKQETVIKPRKSDPVWKSEPFRFKPKNTPIEPFNYVAAFNSDQAPVIRHEKSKAEKDNDLEKQIEKYLREVENRDFLKD